MYFGLNVAKATPLVMLSPSSRRPDSLDESGTPALSRAPERPPPPEGGGGSTGGGGGMFESLGGGSSVLVL